MSPAPLVVAHPDDVISHVLDVMTASGRGRVLVTDPGSGVLVGLLTRRDLLQVRAGVVRAERERRAYFAPLRRRSDREREGYSGS